MGRGKITYRAMNGTKGLPASDTRKIRSKGEHLGSDPNQWWDGAVEHYYLYKGRVYTLFEKVRGGQRVITGIADDWR